MTKEEEFVKAYEMCINSIFSKKYPPLFKERTPEEYRQARKALESLEREGNRE